MISSLLLLAIAPQGVQVGPLNHKLQAPAPSPMPQLHLDWDALYDFGITGSDGFAAVEADTQGNFYAVGSSLGGGGSSFSYEVLTTKYDSAGNLLWARRYDSPGSGFNDTAVDLAVDTDNSVVVLGTGPTSSSDQDVLLFRYDVSGNLMWQTIWSNNWSDGASNVEIAADGSIYVLAASYYGFAGYTNTVLLKFDALGALQWEQVFDGHGGTENAIFMQIGPQGNIYVGGNTIHTAGTVDFDWLGLKYDPAGNLLWVFERGGSMQWPDYVNDMVVTANGAMVLVGYTVNSLSGSSGVADFTTMMVSSSGVLLWEDKPTGVPGNASAVTADAAGHVYVAGTPGTLRSYSNLGQLRWVQEFKNDAGLSGTSRGIRINPQGDLFIVGTTFDFIWGTDILVQKIHTQNGSVLDSVEYSGPLDQSIPLGSGSRMMAFGSQNSIYLAGSSFNGHDNDALLLRFSR